MGAAVRRQEAVDHHLGRPAVSEHRDAHCTLRLLCTPICMEQAYWVKRSCHRMLRACAAYSSGPNA